MKHASIMEPVDDMPNKVALVERNSVPQGIALLDAAAVVKPSKQDLVALVAEIQKADTFVKANACSKLQVIAEQIQFLKQEAEKVLLEAERNIKLHQAACNFIKQPGHVYHLYQRESGQCYFSMLSPEEWGQSAPNQIYKGSYRLEQNHSWTPVEQTQTENNELAILDKLSPVDMPASSIFSRIQDYF